MSHGARVYIASPFWPFERLAILASAQGVDRSYVLMEPGAAALTIARNDAAATPDILQRGSLLIIEADDVATWAGHIVTLEESLSDGVIEISAIGLAANLDARLAPQDEVYRSSTGSGAIVRSLVSRANARGHTGISLPSIVEAGPALDDYEAGGQSVLEALRELADRTGYEWWLDIDASPRRLQATIRWGYEQGEDVSGEVQLWEGQHFAELAYRLDLSQMRQSVTVIGGGGDMSSRSSVTRAAATGPSRRDIGASVIEQSSELAVRSIADLPAGLRTERLVFEPGTSAEAELSRRARRALEKPLGAGEMISVVVNTRADWRTLALGNYIRLHATTGLGDIDRKVRIVGLQPDEEAGVLELVTEVALR